jgi:hypothetical protein
MSVRPSTIALLTAQKRAKARNLATGADKKRVALNHLDVLKAMDRESVRTTKLETEIKTLHTLVYSLQLALRNKSL